MRPLKTDPCVLAVNGGSATVKSALFTFGAAPRALVRETIQKNGTTQAAGLVDWIDRQTRAIDLVAIGHRIVHGGARYHDPQLVTATLLDDLRQLVPFAPNHLPDALALIDALSRARPHVPQFVCFDTAFHHELPEVASRLPIPRAYDEQGVRRYGFHGLSFAYLLQELATLAGPRAAAGRIVLAHLGNGSSLAAVRDGRSIDTSMGFTPIGGVVMSTRSGDLDPGVVTFIGKSDGLTVDQLEDLLSHRAGLLGISDATGDMRALLEREATDSACRLAVAIYCYQIKKCIGAFAAALGGIETLVFSGGIGEHAPAVRARVCEGLEFLGVHVDGRANATDAPVISMPDSPVAVRVIPTDEELTIARAAYHLLGDHDV
jgi:acetate kinase